MKVVQQFLNFLFFAALFAYLAICSTTPYSQLSKEPTKCPIFDEFSLESIIKTALILSNELSEDYNLYIFTSKIEISFRKFK
jgi:hypothetical protein